MKEYRIHKGWAIFIYIFGTLTIAFFSFVLLIPLIPAIMQDSSIGLYCFLAVISIPMIALGIIGILDAKNGKFVISTNSVSSISILSNRELLFTEIKGYRIADKFIFIEPKNDIKKRIRINNNYFGQSNEIKAWLFNNYSNLDIIQGEKEREEILNNQELGWNQKEREEKFKKTQTTAKITNWIGVVIGLWTIFFSKPYEYAIVASIVFPAICVIILKYHKGLIKIEQRKNSAYPNIFFGLLSPVMAIGLRSLLDFKILEYSSVWVPVLLIASICITIIVFCDLEYRSGKPNMFLSIFGLILLSFSYAYGTYVSLNCVFDSSKPEIHVASILKKRMTSGKTTTYYLELTPWGKQTEPDEVSVSKALYNSFQENDDVNIYLMKGKFEIPWFEITDKNTMLK